MNASSLRMALIAGLLLPFGLATAGLAQDAAPPPPVGAPDAHHHHDPVQMRAHMAEHLRAALQLQPSQDAALNAFLDAMKPPAGLDHHDGHGGPGEDQGLTTPQRLDKMLAHADEHHARMVAHVAAVKQFYAQLTPSQQKAFDAMSPMMMHRRGGMGDHGFHHDGGRNPMGAGGPPQG